ncbi:hypothetical protein [Novosphingobium sp. KN65.2]|uniref:hypothetical protein n=1 Tax=Novosphingobium sp. KN65.2 TaxID=1478134 RepID=UPI0005E50774|nr:hypothetical protein [Novosphingobium sp. KN65.2]CDO34041.1 hypothetical protein SPHV1_100075 [Novosphingobium sp. KN65.2]
MAGNSPTQLPAYIQLRYEENGVFDRFSSAAEQAAAQTKKRFNAAFKETESLVTAAVGRISSKFSGLDLGVGDLRQQKVQLQQYRDTLASISQVASGLAKETGDTSIRTKEYLQALSAQRAEAERALQVAEAQITTYSRLQGALDKLSVGKGPDLRDAVQRLRDGDAAIHSAALSGATLEQVMARVANKGNEVKTAWQQAARAAEEAARAQAAALAAQGPTPANALPTNTRFGAEAIVAGQAAMDRAALSGATLEQVLGRVSQKGDAVTASQKAMAASAEQAARDQAQLALAVDRLNAELDPAVAATQRMTAQTRLLDDALKAGAIDAQRHAQLMQLVANASHEGTTAFRAVTNSQGAMRVAMIQSGQQMQDLAISLYSGQRASVVFAQQLPQLAFALTGLEGSANKTYDRIGRFATFLAGPWGLAVGLGAGVLATLIYNMLDVGEAADDATSKTYDFSDSLDVMKLKAEDAATAMQQLASATAAAIKEQGDFLQNQALIANQSVSTLEQQIAQKQRQLDDLVNQTTSFSLLPKPFVANQISTLREQIKSLDSALGSAREASVNADIALSQRKVADSLDAAAAATTKYEDALGKLNTERRKSAELEKSGDPLALATNGGNYLSKDDYEKRLTQIQKTRDAEIEAAREAEKKDRKKTGGRSGVDKAAREAERLANFGDRAAEAIARINERFDDQPRLVDQAAAATRQLDDVIADLEKRKPIGFEQMIRDAEAAKETVQDALVRPFQELTQESGRRLQIQTLLAKGREDEADALTEVWRMEDLVGKLNEDQVGFVRDVVLAEKQRTRELERQRALFEAQLDVLDTAKKDLTDLLSGRGFNVSFKTMIKDLQQAFKDLQGKRLFDSLFGDVFQQLEDELRGQSPLGRESQKLADEMSVATSATDDLAKAFTEGAAAIRGAASGAANDNGASAAFNQAFADIGLPGAVGSKDIVVTAKKPIDLSSRSAVELADKMAGAMVSPLQQALSDAFGTRFGQMLGGVLQGALAGKLVGGTTGGILGGLKGIVDQTGIFGGASGGLSGALGKGLGGAATGTQVAGIANALGLKMSNSGAQIGGAIGSFIPIPGGEIIGAIAGGLLGGLFKKTKWARVLLNSSGSTLQSNSGKYEEAATTAGDSFTSGLQNIADQFGGSIGDFGNITLGIRHGDYRVNTGGTSLKKKKGAVDFDQDAEAAIKYAIMQAIDRGAIAGIRASTQRLLKAGDDLDAALQKALDWENAFRELKSYKDPIGAALDDLDKEFEKLIDLAKQAGASTEEWAQLEELYGIKRDEIIKENSERLTASLQGLLDDLTIGDSGLSLRTREANALARYQPLADRVAAGDSTAYDDYAQAAQDLLDIERELYGSQQQYFDRLNEVTDLTKSRINAETNVVSIAENRDSPFDATGAVKNSIDSQTETLGSKLDALNLNFGSFLQALASGAWGGSLVGINTQQVANF